MIFKMAAAVILENCCTLPLLRFSKSACFTQALDQISSKSVDKWLNGSKSLVFKMAAAAILQSGGTLPLFSFMIPAGIFQSGYKYHQSLAMNGFFTQFPWCFHN
jgi:hypothetical protein